MNVGKTWGIVALTFQTRGPNGKIGVSDFCTWRVYCSSDSDGFFFLNKSLLEGWSLLRRRTCSY
jgi:hypothetical protein